MAGGTIYHAGVVFNMKDIEGAAYMRHSAYDELYFNYSAYSALRRGVIIFRLDDLEKYGNFDARYMGGTTIVDYTYRMTKDSRISIYDANVSFRASPGFGRNADTCFEKTEIREHDLEIFMNKYPEVPLQGDLYYNNINNN
jgi:hypothetical protein